MRKFAANLTMLYNEVDFLDRFAAATKDGFVGVEFLFPYAYLKDELAARLREYSLVQALHNLPADGLSPHTTLVQNDAYSLFAALGDPVITGPTLTKVNDSAPC